MFNSPFAKLFIVGRYQNDLDIIAICFSVLRMLPLNNVTRNLKDAIIVVEIQEIRESPFRAIIFIESGSSYHYVNIRFFFFLLCFVHI